MSNKPPIVLSLCDYTSHAVLPWARAGYECWTVDTQERQAPHDNIHCVTADVMTWLPPLRRYAFVMTWPPCTNLAVSGARWFREKGLAGLADGLRVVERCAEICEWTGAPWMLENPVSTLSSYWRKPDFTFDPCDYGDPYTKKTCLWTGGGFVMPEKSPVPATLGSKLHLMPPSEDRANKRSETPAGFARAVFEANQQGGAS